jgi:hypothetical protein
MDDKQDVLRTMTFGARVAEEEGKDLSEYFVETDQWDKIFAGAVDIVYGPKGSGKSAIYSLLLNRRDELFDRGIMVIPGENPRGTTVFKDLVTNPPTDENEFRNLWKLYFLTLIANHFREYGISATAARKVISLLEEAKLLPENLSEAPLRKLLRLARDYVRKVTHPESVEGGLTTVDPTTGMPAGVTGKITFSEANSQVQDHNLVLADELLELADTALEESELDLWLLLDRLDVAFAEDEDLERNALRALFRVYLDLQAFEHISLKIFLRNDIWQRISGMGIRESSHITRHTTITWDKQSLLNLVVRRVLHNDTLRTYYKADRATTLLDFQEQSGLFYRIYPDQVDRGTRKPETFDWMMSRTSDGTGQTAPRELIHLLSSARDIQLRRLEMGSADLADEALFDRVSLKEALPEVSQVRYEQTLCAEYPSLQKWLQKLEEEKTQQRPKTLAKIWGADEPRALEIAGKLTDVGFFERRGSKEEPVFWVPFIYRDALSMVQGPAE